MSNFKGWDMAALAKKYPEKVKEIFENGKFTDKKLRDSGFILTENGWEKSSKGKLVDMPEKKSLNNYGIAYVGDKTIKLYIKPLSTNVAWKGRRFKSGAYIAYEKEVLWSLPEIVLPEPPYCVSYEFGFSNTGQDLDNSVKQTTDILCKRYKFNDNQIFRLVIDKKIVPKTQEYFQFKIETLK